MMISNVSGSRHTPTSRVMCLCLKLLISCASCSSSCFSCSFAPFFSVLIATSVSASPSTPLTIPSYTSPKAPLPSSDELVM
uniref:Putative secreted protein n=1 Tax=Anopheles marajoara TaxID=58244 RepID=A0A2M4CBP3_9DIPT